jgi:hypothetical protein
MLLIDLLGTTATLFALAACIGNPLIGALCLFNAVIGWRWMRHAAR